MENRTFFMTLGQFLKHKDFVSSGGEAKHRIHTFFILVNGEKENRRGRKLFDGDVVQIEDEIFNIVVDHEN